MAALKTAAQNVQQHAATLGLEIDVVEMPASTRTAEEAAAACGCAVGQIVKSLVFQGKATSEPILLLVSGENRVNEKRARDFADEKLRRPDAAYVRNATGYAIGGIPPFGHNTVLRTLIDQDLLQYDTVWAAAGTPNSVFAVCPKALATAVSAQIVNVT
ncbi:MAG: YbaK/EbsC family protein [Hyphomicrobiaceae bacterium]